MLVKYDQIVVSQQENVMGHIWAL